MHTPKDILENIRELYFEKLEENCVEFLNYDENYPRVLEEYSDRTVEDMLDYIYGDSWQGDWAKMNVKGI